MELKTAIEILEYHQEWRLGKKEDMIHEPKKLTEAFDIVLNEVKKLEASINENTNKSSSDMEKINQILDSLYARVIEPMEAKEQLLDLFADINWVAFDFYKIETRPTEYGKYLICRKDGKIHWETWNGSGWAYNHNEIIYWAVIVPPCS